MTAVLRVSRQPDGQPEIFYSLQGEGASIGTPSVFLRLALCNLACTWCDTKYTWDWRQYDFRQEVMPLDTADVERRILSFDCPHLIITGGEPLLQQRLLAPLVESLKAQGFYFEVETNGAIVPVPELAQHIDQWNVSPKLSTSSNQERERQNPAALQFFRQLPNAYFKFVISEPEDVAEVRHLQRCYQLPVQRIILMPQGQTVDEITHRSQWVSEACAREGYRFSTRLHILLWGDKRGR